jgi:hypothetical protein
MAWDATVTLDGDKSDVGLVVAVFADTDATTFGYSARVRADAGGRDSYQARCRATPAGAQGQRGDVQGQHRRAFSNVDVTCGVKARTSTVRQTRQGAGDTGARGSTNHRLWRAGGFKLATARPGRRWPRSSGAGRGHSTPAHDADELAALVSGTANAAYQFSVKSDRAAATLMAGRHRPEHPADADVCRSRHSVTMSNHVPKIAAQSSLARGLVAAWAFHEGSRLTALTSRSGQPQTLTNGRSGPADVPGWALSSTRPTITSTSARWFCLRLDRVSLSWWESLSQHQ